MPPPERCIQQIAKILGVALNTMKKYYAEELELGLARANAVVSGTLFAQAKKGNITAYLLAEDPWHLARDREGRARRRRGDPSRSGRLDATKLSDEALAELMAARGHAP